MFDLLMIVDSIDDSNIELFTALTDSDKDDMNDDFIEISTIVNDRFDLGINSIGHIALNTRTKSDRYFNIVFTYEITDEKININFDKIKEVDLDGYLDSINENKSKHKIRLDK